MRIACYGLVEEQAGSVASANFLVLEELLRRGHQIDFYAKADFVHPDPLIAHPNFHYKGVLLDDKIQLRQKISPAFGRIINRLAEDWLYRQHVRAIGQRLRACHRERPYEAVLFLGVEPQFDAGTAPVVSWVQGPPQTEWQSIRRLKDQITALCGQGLYWKLKAFYAYKQRKLRKRLTQADYLICGSQWSRQRIIDFGVPAERVKALPYPFDLSFFTPSSESESLSAPRTFLWLGRIDPRKRLDLLLDAFAELVEQRDDVKLKIVGRTSYASGYMELIDRFPHPDHLTYTEHVPRVQVPDLIRQSSAVIQPSESENFGSSVAEALCCGTPVILGPTNGTGEYCDSAAFRFDAYTADSIRRAMQDCLDALASRPEKIAQEARATAERQFNVQDVASKLTSLFQSSSESIRESVA